MSENSTPFVRYYWNRMDNIEKDDCLKHIGIGRSAFYYKMNDPGRFSTREAELFCEAVKKIFGHDWPIGAVLKSVNKSEIISSTPPHVH